MSNSEGAPLFNRRAPKRGRYSSVAVPSARYRQKVKIAQPAFGFEDEDLKPSLRSSLHVDERFLPYGIQPGNILEIKGPASSGKTFLLTYFMVRVLAVYPEKKVLFIDTRHKFNVKNFISIVGHFDKDLSNKLGKTSEERRNIFSKPLPELLEKYPEILTYLDRIQVLQCYTPEDLMLTFGPPNESVVERLLLKDKNVCLVAVDCIDNFSYSETMQKAWAQNQLPNIMHSIRDSVRSTRCPVICTTLIPMEGYHVYQNKRSTPQSKGATSGSTGTSLITPNQPKESGTVSSLSKPVIQASPKTSSPLNALTEQTYVSNFKIDYSVFTNIISLSPVSEVEKDKLANWKIKKIGHCVDAYLRSRQSANTAGSGGNHRVRFSIFSDMLWVV